MVREREEEARTIFLGGLVPFPNAATEARAPVVGRMADWRSQESVVSGEIAILLRERRRGRTQRAHREEELLTHPRLRRTWPASSRTSPASGWFCPYDFLETTRAGPSSG